MVETACAAIAPGQAKSSTPSTGITFSTAFTATPTWHSSSKRRSSKEPASAGSFTSAGGAQWQRSYGSPSSGRRTPEQVPPAPPAPQQHLPPIAEEGESTEGEGASREGASSQDGGRVADLDNKSDLDMTGVGPVLPATRKAPAAEAGAGTGRVAESNPPVSSGPSRRAEIKSIPRHHRPPPGGLKSAVSTTAATPAAATGTCPRSQGQRRGACSILVSPPNSRANAQSRGWTLSESRTDALLAYAKTDAKRLKKQNGSMTCCWKSAWRRNESGWTRCRIGLRVVGCG